MDGKSMVKFALFFLFSGLAQMAVSGAMWRARRIELPGRKKRSA